jgi:DME family drug/metabolite transporter
MFTNGIPLVCLAAVLWATVGVATGLVTDADRWPDATLALSRTILGGPLLLAFALLALRQGRASIRRLRPGRLLMLSAAIAIFQICLFRSFSLIGITQTVFLTVALPPIMLLVLTSLAAPDRIEVRQIGSLAAALLGLWFLMMPSAGPLGGATALGVGHSVLASAAFVCVSWQARAMTADCPAILVSGAGLTGAAVLILGYEMSAGILGGATQLAPNLAGPGLWLALYLALGPTALAYIVFARGMALCRTASAGLLATMIEPAVAALLASFLLDERLTSYEALGCAVLLASVLPLFDGPGSRRVRPDPQH